MQRASAVLVGSGMSRACARVLREAGGAEGALQ